MASTKNNVSGDTFDKSNPNYIEEKDACISSDQTGSLSDSHKFYLIERHGTFDLDPIPSTDPADPYNWPLWKVSTAARD